MTGTSRSPSGATRDEDGSGLRIDAAVFESLSLRGGSKDEDGPPLVLQWFESWTGSRN